MLNALSSLLLAASSTGTAQQLPQAPSGAQQTIIVNGNRIGDYRRRLAECLARHCPTNEDVDATTALAEVLFMAGDYRGARTALLASIGRNRRQAAQYPEPVSDLYRANARVARHLGFDDDARRSTWEILHALQAGIPVEDHRHFTARFEIVESLVAFGQYRQAEHELRELQQAAHTAGRDDVAGAAELRGLWIEYLQDPNSDQTTRRLVELSASPEPRRSIGAKMLLVRIYNERGDRARANALIAGLGSGGPRRQLLYAPTYQLAQQEDTGATASRGTSISTALSRPPPPPGQSTTTTLMVSNLADRLVDQVDDQLIDVSFRIRPDGNVEDVQIVYRKGPSGWEQPLLRSIAGRRYSGTADGSETIRLERYSYTSERRTRDVTGSHIGNRSPRARVEYTELSETSVPPAERH